MEQFSQATDLIVAISALLGATAAVYAVLYFIRFNNRARENLELLRDREFHAQYDRLRETLEAKIAELNHQLTDTRHEFREVNHLLVDAQNASQSLSSNDFSENDFLNSLNVQKGPIDNELIFVLTPFHPREKLTYSAIVKSFEGFDVKVRRGDEVHSSTILSHIVQQISRSRLIIANVSSRNPNVMYELGIAHALGKPVIIVSSTREEKLPFDLSNTRVLFYSSRDELIHKLRNEVARRFFSKA